MRYPLLIAEDDPLLAQLYALSFPPRGFEVRIAPNGIETLKLLADAVPAVLLLDLLMPEMNGLEVLESFKGNPPCPVIVFTNITKEASRKRCLELGAREYVIKCSLSMEELCQCVERHVTR